jgi:hypothetical protein
VLCLVCGCERCGGRLYFFAQGGGFEDLGGGAPAKIPAFDFGEGAEAQGQFQTAVGQVAHLLRLVPFAFADEIGGFGFEADQTGFSSP